MECNGGLLEQAKPCNAGRRLMLSPVRRVRPCTGAPRAPEAIWARRAPYGLQGGRLLGRPNAASADDQDGASGQQQEAASEVELQRRLGAAERENVVLRFQNANLRQRLGAAERENAKLKQQQVAPVQDKDPQCMPAYPEQMSLEEWGELTPVEFQALMEEEQQQQTAEREKLLQGLVPWSWERVRIGAYQILLRVCGFKQEHGMAPSELFAQLVAANDSELQRVAESMGLQSAQLGQEAEAVLTNYHSVDGKVRLYDMEDLEYCVYAARLDMCAAMEEIYPHELPFVHAYEVIKEAVPERFT